MNHEVFAMTIYNGDLIAAGNFDTAGGVSARHVARWNGNSWFNLSSGTTGGTGTVKALVVFNGELIAGGYFTNAGGIAARGIAKWNGTTWSPLGTGLSGSMPYCEALTVYNGELIVGGSFDSAGGIRTPGIAKWTGSTWGALGTGISPNIGVYSVYVFSGILYIGGNFNSVNGISAPNIARYNGIDWSGLGGGIKGVVRAIGDYQGDLIVGGSFDTAGTVFAKNIARWNGSSWLVLSNPGMNQPVYALKTYAGELIAGGYLTTAGGVPCNYIARWNGFFWDRLGPENFNGTNQPVTALHLYPTNNAALMVGGFFTIAGNFPANRIARWGLPLGIKSVSKEIPRNFQLYQNFPNPFNPTTSIRFDLASAVKVKLTIYDARGSDVMEMEDNLSAGSYLVQVDGESLSSGIYFCRFLAGTFQRTIKLSVLK
jgi:hypothetical protein